VRHAALDVVRGAHRALTSAAGALLLVELLRRAGDGRALFRGLRARAARRELRRDDLVEQVLLHVGSEDLVAELDLADGLALQIVDAELHGGLLRT
jgi:hypothetical protein